MTPHDLGVLFDELADAGAPTRYHLDRPFDLAPPRAAQAPPTGPSPNSPCWSARPPARSPPPGPAPANASRSSRRTTGTTT